VWSQAAFQVYPAYGESVSTSVNVPAAEFLAAPYHLTGTLSTETYPLPAGPLGVNAKQLPGYFFAAAVGPLPLEPTTYTASGAQKVQVRL
jgi:hypothetical protein